MIQCLIVLMLKMGALLASTEVTIYDQFAFIYSEETVSLEQGEGLYRVDALPTHVRPHSLTLHAPDTVQLQEQLFHPGLLKGNALLESFIGREVKIQRWNPYQDRTEVVKARLLRVHPAPIYQVGEELFIGLEGVTILPTIPPTLSPYAEWRIANSGVYEKTIGHSYLCDQFSWGVDYTLDLDKERLAALASIENRSGATFEDAQVSLIAGTVNQVQQHAHTRAKVARFEMALSADVPVESLGDYYLYTLLRPLTLQDREMKQVPLFSPRRVEVDRYYHVRVAAHPFYSSTKGQSMPEQVDIVLELINDSETPLPPGGIRVFEEGKFVGENHLQATPVNGAVEFTIGTAFDIHSQKVQKDYRQLTTKMHETAWEVTLTNKKRKSVAVTVFEPMAGNWELVEESHSSRKVDANTLRYDVVIPADGEVVINYRVRVGY